MYDQQVKKEKISLLIKIKSSSYSLKDNSLKISFKILLFLKFFDKSTLKIFGSESGAP